MSVGPFMKLGDKGKLVEISEAHMAAYVCLAF